MIYKNKEKFSNTVQTTTKTQSYTAGHAMMSIFHMLVIFFALYLSFKCNGGFNILSFLIAFCCPYCYILYALAIKGCLSNSTY